MLSWLKGSMDYSARLKLSPINPGHTQPHNTMLNKLSTLHIVGITLVTCDSTKGNCGIDMMCIGKALIHPRDRNLRLSLSLVKSSRLLSDIVRMVTSQLKPGTSHCNILTGKVSPGDTCSAGYCGCDCHLTIFRVT